MCTLHSHNTYVHTAGWENRWIVSTAKGSEAGKFVESAGKFYNDAEADKGLQTSEDARFYGT